MNSDGNPMDELNEHSDPAAQPSGLLIAAHGAARDGWNNRVFELGNRVRDAAIQSGSFTAVRTAMLELVQPDIATAVDELQRDGCRRLVAVPLFIGPSGHVLFDVPAALGIHSPSPDRKMLPRLRRAQSEVPITMTASVGHVLLSQFALDEARRLSVDAANEAIVFLAHGSSNQRQALDALLQQVAVFCRGQTRIDYADWAYVGIGRSYAEIGIPAMLKAARQKQRVLVIGLYVASGARGIHERSMLTDSDAASAIKQLVAERRLIHSDGCLAKYAPTSDWILQTARDALL